MKQTTALPIATLILMCGSLLSHAVEVTNVKDGEVFSYPLVIVEGKTKSPLTVETTLVTSFDTSVANAFRGVVHLKAGKNSVTFEDSAGKKTVNLTYKPPTTKDYRVKVWYVVPKGEDPMTTQADQLDPLYQTKLDILTKAMQAWVAEDMKRGGYGPKTFYPEFRKDDPSRVDVGLLHANLTRPAWTLQGDSYGIARSVLPKEYDTPQWRNLAFITCRNVAQSSGNFCVIGYGTMVPRSPTKLADFVKAMQTPDPNGVLSYRAFTGVTLHEFGHMIHWAWHPGGYNLIQSAYENVGQAFTMGMEPGVPHNEADRSSFGVQQELFNNNRFFATTGEPKTYKDGPIEFATKDGKFSVKATYPLGAVYYYLPEINTQVAKLGGKKGKTWEMDMAEIAKALNSDGRFHYMAVDVEGNEAHGNYVPPGK